MFYCNLEQCMKNYNYFSRLLAINFQMYFQTYFIYLSRIHIQWIEYFTKIDIKR